MKKFVLLLIAAACLIFSLMFFKKESKEDKEEPGWNAQYYEMKKNAAGEIPMGMNAFWQQQDRINGLTGSASNLDSIKLLGPYNVGGRTRAILVDILDNTHYFAGGVAGGFAISLMMVLIKDNYIKILGLLVLVIATYFIQEESGGFYYLFFAVFLPTLIHVFIFTFFFFNVWRIKIKKRFRVLVYSCLHFMRA